MMKTQHHDLLITTRTSIQDPSIQPPGGNRSTTFYILEQGEHEGEDGFWEDEEGLEGFMAMKRLFWVLEENDAFIARKVSGRNFRFKKRKGKGKSGSKKGSQWLQTFQKSGSGGKARHIGEKAKERKGRKENRNSSIPVIKTRVGKGKGGHDKGKSKTFAATAENLEEQSANQQSTEPTYAGWTDQDWDPSWNWSESGWYSSMRHETSSTGQALMAFHNAFQQHEKEAIHEKLIQDEKVSEHNLSVTTKQSLLATKMGLMSAQSNLCESGQRISSPTSTFRPRPSSHLPMERQLRSVGPCISSMLQKCYTPVGDGLISDSCSWSVCYLLQGCRSRACLDGVEHGLQLCLQESNCCFSSIRSWCVWSKRSTELGCKWYWSK